MFQTLPGTLLERSQTDDRSAYSLIEPILSITKGLTLSQIRELTGLENSTVQNWVKRGWVANPKSKRYGERQVMRIILINALRASLQLDSIAQLMQYLNGSVEDVSDDIISDGELYDYLCAIVFELEDAPVLDETKRRNIPLPPCP